MKARPVSPYRLKIRQMELEIEELRRLDAEWRADRIAVLREERRAGKPIAMIARRLNLSEGYARAAIGGTYACSGGNV